jgi:very-short-patch-repair endonuclease
MLRKKYSPRYVVEIARKLRLEMTNAEKILWSRIGKKQLDGFRFRNQHPIGRYIADFYCHELRLIIEIDGGIHNERKEYDGNRDGYLQAGGYIILRFTNNKITSEIDSVLEIIRTKAREITISSPTPGDLGGCLPPPGDLGGCL